MAVTANTTIQLAVPDHLRGRVMSVYTTVFAGSVPAGGLLMGWIASRWGVPMAFGVGAAATVAVGLGAWLWLSRIPVAHQTGRRVALSALPGAGGESTAAAPRAAMELGGEPAGLAPIAESSADPNDRAAGEVAMTSRIAAGPSAESAETDHAAAVPMAEPATTDHAAAGVSGDQPISVARRR
jgi:MFS family permease